MPQATTELNRKTEDGSMGSATGPLSAEKLRKMHAYWRAANYLSVGQIYLMDNPLLKEPLQLKHVKPRLIEHKQYIRKHGDDMPEIALWRWGHQQIAGGPRETDTAGDNA